jgi:glutaredoxin
MSTLRIHLALRSRFLLKASFPLAVYSYQREQWRTFSESVVPASHPPDITLYQYKICPYCSRPKTLLDFLRVPYRAVEVNPLTKSQISFSKDYKKVPIANVNGELVNDSSAIVEALGRVLSKDPKIALAIQSLGADDW